MDKNKAYQKLTEHGIRPSIQRLAIMDYILTHHTHPTVDDVYQGLCDKISTLSRTTVYNTLRMFSENEAAMMLSIDEHRVCYDGNTEPHVHFFCKKCGKVIDLFDEIAPIVRDSINLNGNIIEEKHLYYKGVCAECAKK